MPKISIYKLEPGMRLTKSVYNENGIVLLNQDTELTEATIERLKEMGIEGVYVKGLSKPEKSKEEVLSELNRKFEKVEGEPYMEILKKALQEHIEGLYG